MKSALRWGLLALLVAGTIALLVTVDRFRRERWRALPDRPVASASPSGRPPMRFTASADCQPCHAALYREWSQSPHARPWGTHPFIPSDPLRIECSPCHIPDQIYEIGLEKPIQIRHDRYHEGVDCIACHVARGESLGPGPTREAPCNPRHEPTMTQVVTCKPCHGLHGTHAEWARSRYASGPTRQTCQDCHMPRVERVGSGAAAGRSRAGRSHRILGGRDRALLVKALRLEMRAEGGRFELSLTNDGAGHAVPGEINNRRLELQIRVAGLDGRQTERLRSFQAPPRPRRGLVPTTQIMPDETVREALALPPLAATVEVALVYRLLLLDPAEPYRVERLRIVELLGWRRLEWRRLR